MLADDCVTLDEVESRAVLMYDTFSDIDGDRLCAALQGWRVKQWKQGLVDRVVCGPTAWYDEGFCLEGWTDTSNQTLWVVGTDYWHNALVHEMAHVVAIDQTGRGGHCNWQERGIKAAIMAVTGERDETPAESRCEPLPDLEELP